MNTVLYLHEAGDISGAENSLLNLIGHLDKEKFRAIAACPSSGRFAGKLSESGALLYSCDFPRIRSMRGVRRTVNLLREIIAKETVDLIHSNSIRTHLYAWLSGGGRIPLVWHERNLPDKEKEMFDPDRLFAFLPDAIICNSNAVADRFMRRGKLMDKVYVIHNGVDTTLFNPEIDGNVMRQKLGISSEEIVVGIASRFHKIKGHETFFKAAASILTGGGFDRNRLRFLVAGGAVFGEDKWREEYLKKYVKEVGIDDRVIFTGSLDAMPEAYAAMDIFVLASLIEACGRVVVEAMASGKPVIGTNTGGTPEMVIDGKTGILVPCADAAALTAAVRTLINDPGLRLSMGREARKRVEEFFTIEKNVDKTEELYLKLFKRTEIIK